MPIARILTKHVRAAAKTWDRNPGLRGFRNGTTYEVVIGGKGYPPKAIASIAHELAGNKDLLYPRDFAGAWEGKWHKLLEEAGFKPVPKSKRITSNSSKHAKPPLMLAEIDEAESFAEGAQHYAQHVRRERDPRVVKLAKALRWQEKKAFACDVCNFDFAKTYGERGEGYIEAHHTIPVEQMKPGHKTLIADLVLVCSNCHRMLHTMKPLVDIKQLKAQLFKATSR